MQLRGKRSGKLKNCLRGLKENMKAWFDEFMLYGNNEDHLLQLIRRFFEICRCKRLTISILKFDFFLTEVAWCSQMISKDRMRFNCCKFSGLAYSDPPRTAFEQCEYI